MKTPCLPHAPLTPAPDDNDRQRSPFPLTAWLGFGLTVIGSATGDAVMLGLIGFPVAILGMVLTAVSAPALVRPRFGGGRKLLARVLALAAGISAALSAPAFASATAAGLVGISRGTAMAGTIFGDTVMEGRWALWLAGPVLGLLATFFARGRFELRDLGAPMLWTAHAPTSALVLVLLLRLGLIALTA